MFAYTTQKKTRPSRKEAQARHFAFRERRTLGWTDNCVYLILASVAFGGLARLLSLEGAFGGLVLTLVVAACTVQDTPDLETPVWQGRLMLVSTATFTLVLGYAFGSVGIAGAIAAGGAYRALQR